jgi:hypothetical protein
VTTTTPADVTVPPVRAIFASRAEGPWLFGRTTDLAAFGGSAVLSFAALALGAVTGLLHGDAPAWVWLSMILAVDVAHVWSTSFRVYLDGAEVRRRPLLYLGVPVACYAVGVAIHATSADLFWRVLAYVAVFHFVRQQYGWIALYGRRAGEAARLDRALDTVAIYSATVYPLLWWHAHLPRAFVWFVEDDFVRGLATPLAGALLPLYWLVLAAFCARQVWLVATGRTVVWGKVLVVLTTWACWWAGIMAFDSDYAFTVTNVLIHGIPYLVLTYRYGRARAAQASSSGVARVLRGGAVAFVAFVVAAAFLEEALWDRWVWHDRPWLFGPGAEVSATVLTLLVPLLALPQATHYVLDAWIWRVRKNPRLREELS